MLNRSVLIGRTTSDGELKYTTTGNAVYTVTLAVDRPFKNSNGEKETDFISIVVWRQLAETCANYVRKGMLVAVEGRIQVRSWESENGRRYVTEVVADNVRFLESKRQQNQTNQDPFQGEGEPVDIDDRDLPF